MTESLPLNIYKIQKLTFQYLFLKTDLKNNIVVEKSLKFNLVLKRSEHFSKPAWGIINNTLYYSNKVKGEFVKCLGLGCRQQTWRLTTYTNFNLT